MKEQKITHCWIYLDNVKLNPAIINIDTIIMTANKSSVIENMNKIKEAYYSKKTKNIFFKKTQAGEIAANINQELSLEELIENTVYLIPDTNSIYIDYPVFKMYATISNYQIFIDRFINIMKASIVDYGAFQVHINLKSFSISSIEKYQNFFQMYYNSCISQGLLYNDKIVEKIIIYNTPSIITSISVMIIKYTEPSIKNKIVYHDKNVSEIHLGKLFNK